MFKRNMLMALLLVGLGILAGCASGGGGSRGSLSQASANSAGKDQGKDRDEDRTRSDGRSRTKEDVHDPGSPHYAHQDDTFEESGGGGGFLFGLITSLFTNDDPEPYDPYDYPDEIWDGPPEDYETWEDHDEFGMDPPGENEEEDGSGGGLDIKRGNLNFWFSPSTLGGDAIQGFTTYTLMYSGYTGRQYRAHAGLYYGRGKKGSQQNIQEGIRWISEAGIDVGTRGYFTSDHSLMGFYMILGLRAGATYWSYQNAIEAPNDDGTTETISTDGLMVFVPYVGLGSSFLQTRKVHLGLNFTVGGRIYTSRTFENFSNDLLKDVWEYKLNLEASFFF